MTNSEVSGSYSAVVSIYTALLPKPSSVKAKQPIVLKESTPSAIYLCLSVPRIATVPPKRFN